MVFFGEMMFSLNEIIVASLGNDAGICGESYFSKKYAMYIVDRVGGGDSFGGRLIYSLLKNKDPQSTIEFAVVASCLKHFIGGDYIWFRFPRWKPLQTAMLPAECKDR